MNSNDMWVLLAMVIYFAIVLGIGFFYAKRSNASSESYFIGGRKAGPWLTALSAEASDMSGWLLMGLPGVAYFTGASDAIWTAIGLAIGTYLNWKFVAKRLRKYSVVANNSITLPEFFSNRFHDKKNILVTIAALVTLIFFCVYTATCFVSVGKLFSTLFNVDYATLMVIGALIVFLYTFVGGYLSVITTDSFQALLMFFALAIIFIGSVVMAGGVDNTVAFLRDIPGFLSVNQIAVPMMTSPPEGLSPAEVFVPQQVVEGGVPQFGVAGEYGIISMVSMLAWGLGYFGMPHILVRFMGIRSAEEIKKSRIIAVTWCVVSLTCAVCIGLVGRAAIPTEFLTGGDAERIFIVLTQMLLPAFVCGIVVSGILAAAMSSASSYLLCAGSSFASDIYRKVFKKDASDRQVMIIARITLFVVLILGILMALDENSSIFTLVSYAWAGFGAAFGPLVLLSLYWRRINLPGALAGMLTGTTVVLVWQNLLDPLGGIWKVYELLPAFILAFIAIVVVSLLTKPPSKEITDEFDSYMQAEV